jgi:hypothetical protein
VKLIKKSDEILTKTEKTGRENLTIAGIVTEAS